MGGDCRGEKCIGVLVLMEGCRAGNVVVAVLAATLLWLGGCGGPAGKAPAPVKLDATATIGSVTEVFAPNVVPVEGYGLVGGLAGTGSRECPPRVRSYLRRYILSQLPAGTDADELIADANTAVVRLTGLMPARTWSQRFDLRVEALGETRTTSLRGGWLYKAELFGAGTFGLNTRVLGTAEGPVFIDPIDPGGSEARAGYILAGGQARTRYPITLALREPDYIVARRISNVLNTRFGQGTAEAVAPELIRLRIPSGYAQRRQRFIDVVKATYVVSTPQLTAERIDKFAMKLAGSAEKYQAEVGLEAIGRASIRKLAVLFNSASEEVRFRAARCALYVGDEGAAAVLAAIARTPGSRYRVAALKALADAAARRDAASVAMELLDDRQFEVRFAAYEQLRRLDDISVVREALGRSMYLEQVPRARRKEIYVSRSGRPRIVLFGSPIRVREGVFIETADGSITIDAPKGQAYVSLIRKVPGRAHVAKLTSSFELADIIRKLSEEPVVEKRTLVRVGLNVSYAGTIALIKKLCDSGAVDAAFRAGPLPAIGQSPGGR